MNNGNGAPASPKNAARTTEGNALAVSTDRMELPAWLTSIREAVTGAISADDLAAIMATQIQKARAGDEKAAKFVLDQACKFSQMPGLTIVQNNNYYSDQSHVEQPEKPAQARPGHHKKVDLMRRRMEAGLPLTRPDDAGGEADEVDLS